MRLTLVLAACLAASPALAEEAEPECLTPAAALSNALAHGATAGRLDGVEAQAPLDAINSTGEPTDYRADTVVVVLRPDRAVVAMFGACLTGNVTVRLDAFAEAWDRARGRGV